MEVNARIQVEHPITEAVTGVDIVEQQLSIALGIGLHLKQRDISSGHEKILRFTNIMAPDGKFTLKGLFPELGVYHVVTRINSITAITLYGKYLTRSVRGIFIVFCRRSSVCCEKLAIPKLCAIIPALMIVNWITSPLFTVIVGPPIVPFQPKSCWTSTNFLSMCSFVLGGT